MTKHKRTIALSKASRVLPKYARYTTFASNGDTITISYYCDKKDYWKIRPKSRRVRLHSTKSVALG